MSQRDADTFISKNEREFIIKALAEEARLDGRRPYDVRTPNFQFSLDDRSATVSMGSTRVMAVVSATLEAPYPDRPSEGPLRFNVEFTPMASPAFEPGKPGEDAIQVARLIERGLRQSGAVDQEALCVVAGRKVWGLRVDCHVLDAGGNTLDAAFLAALAALMAFRKPETEVGGPDGTTIVVHPPEVREPLPLTIHHLPVSVTFALFQGGDVLLLDPTWKEAAAAQGLVTIVMNPANEVCCVHKAEGIGLTAEQLLRCVRLAGTKATEAVAGLRKALEQHEVARVQARVRRHAGAVGLPTEGRHVMVLGAKDPAAGPPIAPAPAPALAGASKPTAAPSEESDDGSSSDEEEAPAVEAKLAPKTKAGDVDMAEAKSQADAGAQPKARLAGPLLGDPKKAKKAKATPSGTPDKAGGAGGGGGALAANKRGKDGIGFDELEAIAAVIAGVPPGGAATGAPEPDLARAVKPGKGRKGGK